jgi:hypothetical protein
MPQRARASVLRSARSAGLDRRTVDGRAAEPAASRRGVGLATAWIDVLRAGSSASTDTQVAPFSLPYLMPEGWTLCPDGLWCRGPGFGLLCRRVFLRSRL